VIFPFSKMALVDIASFDIGFMLAEILRSIQYDIATRPLISAELSQFEKRFDELKENIKARNIVDRDEVILTILRSFRELQEMRSQNEP